MNNDLSSEEKSSRGLRRLSLITVLWLSVVAVILAIQSNRYTGLYANISEWQFSNFERLFPISTILALALLLTLPLIIFLSLRKKRHRKLYGKPRLSSRIKSEELTTVILRCTTLALFVISLVAGLQALQIGKKPNTKQQKLDYQVGKLLPHGPIQEEALVLYNRIGYYSQDTLLTKRSLYLAPVMKNADAQTIKYFKVVESSSVAAPSNSEVVKGYIRKVALPGGFERLFTNSGYKIDEESYVIFPDSKSALKPHFGLTETLLRLSFLFLLGTLLHWAYLRKLRKKFKGL